MTPDSAWLLAQTFDTTPQLWLNLQALHDLALCRPVRPTKPIKIAV